MDGRAGEGKGAGKELGCITCTHSSTQNATIKYCGHELIKISTEKTGIQKREVSIPKSSRIAKAVWEKIWLKTWRNYTYGSYNI